MFIGVLIKPSLTPSHLQFLYDSFGSKILKISVNGSQTYPGEPSSYSDIDLVGSWMILGTSQLIENYLPLRGHS